MIKLLPRHHIKNQLLYLLLQQLLLNIMPAFKIKTTMQNKKFQVFLCVCHRLGIGIGFGLGLNVTQHDLNMAFIFHELYLLSCHSFDAFIVCCKIFSIQTHTRACARARALTNTLKNSFIYLYIHRYIE